MGLLGRQFLAYLMVVLSMDLLMANGEELLHDYLHEYGHDFGAYPSHFSPMDGVKFDKTVRFGFGLLDMKKVLLRAPTTVVKVVDVLKFGAKGDGKIDDTVVSIYIYMNVYAFVCMQKGQDHISKF